ncbi:MAG: AIR carboxylase family protein, partial [Candidatus Thermoplasmatota archaeon]|nr:AIR carboxylase family protein [Candidatus Thermoplasmatota archaeon]
VTGSETERAYDIGVAGPHRLARALEGLAWEPDVIVCAAGREAALPVVLAGLVEPPVIAVPTSVGYGHGGQGEAALKGVLQSCAPLLTVNIDAGLVAGLCASKIARLAGRGRR